MCKIINTHYKIQYDALKGRATPTPSIYAKEVGKDEHLSFPLEKKKL